MQSVCSEVRFCEKSRVKRSFWKLGLSLLVKVSWKTLVLEAWIVTFGESLVENARFGSLDCHFWWKSRVKRSFRKLGLLLLVKVSCKNARFGSLDCHFWWKSRGKRSFWKLGLSLLVKVSWKTLVVEAWIVTFGESLAENARFGSLDCHFWWKSRGKCSFWKLCLVCKSVLTREASKSVKQECPARVSSKSVKQRVSRKSV